MTRALRTSALVFTLGAVVLARSGRASGQQTAPVVHVSPPEVGPSYPPSLIRHVLHLHRSEVLACSRASGHDMVSGSVRLRFRIVADGSVAESTVVRAAPALSAAAQCIAERVRHWRFPEPTGGATLTVEYPLELPRGW